MNIKKSQNYLSATGGTIDGTVIGGTTPEAGSFVESVITHGATETATAISLYGDIHKITGAYVVTLPSAVIGMGGVFRASTAATFSVNPNDSDHFEMYDGTVLDAGDSIASGGTKNEFVQIYCESANTWIVVGINGAFTDAS
jgi:hypothetical protein